MRKIPNILIEINIDRYRRTKDRRDIFGVMPASNDVMEASDDVLAASDDVLVASNDVLAASNGKYANVR